MTDKCTSPEGHKYISEWNEAVGQGWIRCKNCSDIPEPPEIARRLTSLTEKVEGYADALEEIVNWSKAYPLDVFPEPDLKKAHKILKANGMTLDAISASAIRHVVTVTGKMAADALLESE